MDLEVTSINFLASGKLSVEVTGRSPDNPPTPPALDVIRLRFYMACAPTETIGEIKEQALKLARESLAGTA